MKPATLLQLLSLSLAAMLAGIAPAQAGERMAVSDLKPLLKHAIEHGTAHGVLGGKAAAYMQQKFGTTAALEIDVRTLHPLPQPGCSRLEVTSRQNGVVEKGQRTDQTLTYQLNYCRNGGFPRNK